jgi:hypothetical protein
MKAILSDVAPRRMVGMDERRPNGVLILAIVLALLPVLYVGSYYALVRRAVPDVLPTDEFGVAYAIGDPWSKPFFLPMHELDLKLRPSYWSFGIIGVHLDSSVDPRIRQRDKELLEARVQELQETVINTAPPDDP